MGAIVEYASRGTATEGPDQEIIRAGYVIASVPGRGRIGQLPDGTGRRWERLDVDSLWIGGVEVITAARVLQNVSGAGGAFHGATVLLTSNQAVPASTDTLIAWSAEELDTDGYWNPGTPAVFQIPAGQAGRYLVTYVVSLQTTPTADAFTMRIRRNGATRREAAGFHAAFAVTCWTISHVMDLAVGDTVDLQVRSTADPVIVRGAAVGAGTQSWAHIYLLGT